MRVLIVLVAALLAAGAACGGDGNGDDSAGDRVIESEAQARAESIGLTLSDFPDGWTASPPGEEGASQEEARKCLGADFSAFTVIGEARSAGFASGAAQASSEVGIFESEAEADGAREAFLEGMAGEKVDDCMHDFIAASVGEGFEIGAVDVSELTFMPPDVEEASSWQVVIPIEVTSGDAAGVSVTGYLDLVHLSEGDVIATVTVLDVDAAFDPQLRDELLEAVASRMSA